MLGPPLLKLNSDCFWTAPLTCKRCNTSKHCVVISQFSPLYSAWSAAGRVSASTRHFTKQMKWNKIAARRQFQVEKLWMGGVMSSRWRKEGRRRNKTKSRWQQKLVCHIKSWRRRHNKSPLHTLQDDTLQTMVANNGGTKNRFSD